VKKIIQKHPNSQHVLIWDGAPCHRSKEFLAPLRLRSGQGAQSKGKNTLIKLIKIYLSLNGKLLALSVVEGSALDLHLMRHNKTLSRCPERSRREDIWLRGKTWVRKNFASIQIFDEAIQIFRDCLSGEYFSFDKIRSYVAL